MPRLTRIPSLLFACRLDTDSGLGRATPPRRAPSPGMGMGASGRHMPSPSGPGSLPPGLISKRRGFDDGSSDFSLTPNLNMEYSGLYLSLSLVFKTIRKQIISAIPILQINPQLSNHLPPIHTPLVICISPASVLPKLERLIMISEFCNFIGLFIHYELAYSVQNAHYLFDINTYEFYIDIQVLVGCGSL